MEKLATTIVRDGPLAAEDAVGWVFRLATTLEVLHLAGRAHGRISAKAIDLLARPCNSAAFLLDEYELPDDPCFQSPERIGGGEPSEADDVWAIGVLLFFVLTGELPFPGPTAIEVSAALLAAEPPDLARHGVEDKKLGRLVEQLLALDRARRLRSLHPLRSVLSEWYDFVETLPPLSLGKPKLAVFDSVSDDDGQKLTEIVRGDNPVLLAIRREAAARAAAEASAPPEQASASGEDESTIRVDPADLAQFMSGASAASSETPARSAAPSSDEGARLATAAADPPKLAPASPVDADPAHAQEAAEPRAAAAQAPADEGGLAASNLFDDLSFSGLEQAADDRADPYPGEAGPPPASRPSHEPARVAAGRGWRLLRLLGALLFLALGGAAGYFWFHGQLPAWLTRFIGRADAVAPATDPSAESSPGEPDGPASASAREQTSAADAGPPPDASVDPSVDAGTAAAGTTAARSAPEPAPVATLGADAGPPTASSASSLRDLARCVGELFPPDAWSATAPPELGFICAEDNPIKGARRLHVALTAAGAGRPQATRAMHEWALLTWYDKPVFALAHHRCCERPSALVAKPAPGSCPFDDALRALAAAALGGNPAALDAGRRRYDAAATCILGMGLGTAFGHSTLPASGSFTVFERIASRARKARGAAAR